MTLFAIKNMLRQQTLNKLWESNKLFKVSTVLLSATTLSTASLYAYESHQKLREEERERQIQARIDAEVERELGVREAIREAMRTPTKGNFEPADPDPRNWPHIPYPSSLGVPMIDRRMKGSSKGVPKDYDEDDKEIPS